MDPKKRLCALAASVAAAVFSSATTHVRADVAIFGQAFTQPVDTVFFPTYFLSWGFPSDPDTGNLFDYIGATSVPQFNPTWGTLETAHVTILPDADGVWFYASSYGDGTVIGATFDVLSYSATDSSIKGEATFSNDLGPGPMIQTFPHESENTYSVFDNDVGITPFEGTGTYDFKVEVSGTFIDNFNIYSSDSLSVFANGAAANAVTYTYNPASGGGGGGGGGSSVMVGSAGGSYALANQPSGGWSVLTVATNGTLTIAPGDSLVSGSIQNYGTINQTGGNLTVSGALNQVANSYTSGNITYAGGIYNLSGGNANLGSLTGNGGVNFSGGNLTVGAVDHSGNILQTGGVFLANNFTQTGAAYLDANTGNASLGGVYTLSNGTASLGNITNNGIVNQSGGNLTANSYNSSDRTYTDSNGTTQHFGVLNLTGGHASLGIISGSGSITTANGTSLTASKISMPGGTLNINGNLTLTTTAATRQTPDVAVEVGNLTLGTAGLLDLQNHDLIIHGGQTLSSVESLIVSAYDSGAWDGTSGITSVGMPSGMGLGYATAGQLGISTFDGISVSPTDILVKYTFLGDANLDGQVNIVDLNIVSNHWQETGASWAQGDFNYDSIVDIRDLNSLNANYNAGTTSPMLQVASAPEPASLAMLTMGAAALLRRRDQRKKLN